MRRSLFVGMVLTLLGGALANAEEIVQEGAITAVAEELGQSAAFEVVRHPTGDRSRSLGTSGGQARKGKTR